MKKQLALLSALTLLMSCCTKYESFADYPSFSSEWTEMTYTPRQTDFMLWAPTADEVKIKMFNQGIEGEAVDSVDMKRGEDGRWTAQVKGDLNGVFYAFNVKLAGKWLGETPGVMAKAVGANGRRAVILDLRTTDPDGWENDRRPELKSFSDIILYEMHHRDFSMDSLSGIYHRGKFLALTEEGTKNCYGQTT